MPKTNSLLSVLQRVQKHTPKEFVAPLPAAESITMSVMQDGVPYRFHIYTPAQPGWYVVKPNRLDMGVPERLASPDEMLTYLAALPRFRVIVLFRVADNTWACAPANAPDAAQRGWNGEPRLLNIVRENVQPLDVAYARSLAGMLLYDELDTRTSQADNRDVRALLEADANAHRLEACSLGNSSLQVATQMLVSHFDEMRRAEMQARALEEAALEEKVRQEQAERRAKILAAQNRTTEEKIQGSLSFMGAQLVDWKAAGKNFAVTWMLNGRQATTVVRPNMVVESAGFCLDGTDDEHTLTSIIQVMEEARVSAHRTDGAMRSYNSAGTQLESPLKMALGDRVYRDDDDDD